MARFNRDESRTFKLLWFLTGGFFAVVSAWAMYNDGVTRVPWQVEQKNFYAVENEQAKKNLERTKAEFAVHGKAEDDRLQARKKELSDAQKPGGSFAEGQKHYNDLSQQYADAEQEKTFAKSDLDEAYYYRELAEYARDEALNRARAAMSARPGGQELATQIFADPPPPARDAEDTDDMYHLRSEREKNQRKVDAIEKYRTAIFAADTPAFDDAEEQLRAVVARVDQEIEHQTKVDAAVAKMNEIDGPPDPAAGDKDEKLALDKRKAVCDKLPKHGEDTRHCVQWVELDPITQEVAQVDRDVAKLERPLSDAQQRLDVAGHRANPKFEASPGKLIDYLVGVYQIQQVVTAWNEADADVDKEQVDRCPTCHMGADSANYTDPTIPRQFQTHPFRSTLFAAHPIEKFGCTSCHQGEGRSTDLTAHSGFAFHPKDGQPRWEYVGDKFWEDPLLPTGELFQVHIDGLNDELALKVDAKGSPGDWTTVRLASGEFVKEREVYGAIQQGAAAAVGADIAKSWRIVVRKTGGRVSIGLEQTKPNEVIEDADKPTLRIRFTKPELAEMLGFSGELYEHAPSYTATWAPSEPVRSNAQEAWDDKGRYTPPTAQKGLQITPEFRDRFILALPEVEASCFRCHSQDVDLRPRSSKAKWIFANLDAKKAAAEAARNPDKAKAELPEAKESPDPFTEENPVPLFTEGRWLFRRLNCTGCHILDGFPGNRNTGPALDNITAKSDAAWILKWIRYPRAWRHKTKMPNLWPAPIDPAAKKPYPLGSPEYREWEEQMKQQTINVAAYLIDRSENPATRPSAQKMGADKRLADVITGYANVPGATAADGKLIFDAYGCRGCHATSEADLPVAWRTRERDIAPSLSNIGSKTNEDWIAYWVENPSRYWHGTKMPQLRLDRREAASVAKYLMTLKEEPPKNVTGGTAEVSPDEVALLKEPSKRQAKIKCDIASNEEMSRVACGEKLIANYGCFGCHQIDGFEGFAPIAPELNSWAKKDLSQLDYGYAVDDHHQQTHETFAVWKLDSPRIYRRDRIELKMGDFDLSPREIRALVVFMMGLNDLKPQPEYNPYEKAGYQAAVEGRQIVDDYNCRGCHLVEGWGADFITAKRKLVPDFDEQLGPPHLTGEGARVQPEWFFTFLRAPGDNGIRPVLHPEWVWGEAEPPEKFSVKMPTFPFSSEQATAVVRYFAAWEGAEYPYVQAKVKELSSGEKMDALLHMNSSNDTGGNCISCHYAGDFPVERGKTELEKMGPSLGNVYKRLRPEWTRAWVMKPSDWLPYTKMPAFWPDPFGTPLSWTQPPGFAQPKTADGQIEMVSNYLYLLREHTKLPRPGEELRTPVLGLGDESSATAAIPPPKAVAPPAKGGGARPGAPQKGGAKHGAIEGPTKAL